MGATDLTHSLLDQILHSQSTDSEASQEFLVEDMTNKTEGLGRNVEMSVHLSHTAGPIV